MRKALQFSLREFIGANILLAIVIGLVVANITEVRRAISGNGAPHLLPLYMFHRYEVVWLAVSLVFIVAALTFIDKRRRAFCGACALIAIGGIVVNVLLSLGAF